MDKNQLRRLIMEYVKGSPNWRVELGEAISERMIRGTKMAAEQQNDELDRWILGCLSESSPFSQSSPETFINELAARLENLNTGYQAKQYLTDNQAGIAAFKRPARNERDGGLFSDEEIRAQVKDLLGRLDKSG